MRLYHSSNTDFEIIDLSRSKPNKDFGRAKVILQGGEFTMLSYDFDESLLVDGSLKVLSFKGYTKEWAEFIFANRDFTQDSHHDYDIVYGPIANDNVGEQKAIDCLKKV